MAGPATRIQVDTRMSVSSPAFRYGERIPERHTCEGANLSPPLDFAQVPDDAQALALIMEDVDAANGAFTHWVVWNLPADIGRLDEGVRIESIGGDIVAAKQGRTSFGGVGYRGPCPPSGESHRYYVHVFALREPLRLEADVPRDRVEAALEGRVLAYGEFMGTYEKLGEPAGGQPPGP